MAFWKEKLERKEKVKIVKIDSEKMGEFSRESWE